MLISAFSSNVTDDPRISDQVKQQVSVRVSAGASFVAADQVRSTAEAEGLDPATTDALVRHYEDAQLTALKVAFLGAALLVVVSFFFTSRLPTRRFDELEPERGPPVAAT
jgi:type VI protein secretion system component VasF